MKATCKREALIEALDRIRPIIKGKKDQDYFLTTQDGQLAIYTTDGTSTMVADVKAQIGTKGQAVLSATSVAFLKRVSGNPVTLSTSHKSHTEDVELERPHWDYGSQPAKFIEAKRGPKEFTVWSLKVEVGKANAVFPIRDPKEIKGPILDAKDIAKLDPIPIKAFGDALCEVGYAVEPVQQGSTTILSGVGIAPSVKGLDLVACDSFRMAVTTIKSKVKIPPPATIPPKMVDILVHAQKVIYRQKRTKEGTLLVFQYDGLTLITRSMGAYPKYLDKIPATTRRAVRVYSDDLREAVNTAMTTVGRLGAIRLIGKGKTLRVLGMADGASSEAKIASKGTIKQCYEAKYLLQMLERAGEVVDIRLPVDANERGWWPLPAIVKNNGSTHLICARSVDEWDPAKAKAVPVAAATEPAAADDAEDLELAGAIAEDEG
jgi:hypothetical protein